MKKNDFELKELLNTFKRHPKYKDKIYLEVINRFWKEEMGKSIAQGIINIHLQNGVLFMSMQSSVIKSELRFSKEAIVRKMNDVIGEEYIKDVIFR